MSKEILGDGRGPDDEKSVRHSTLGNSRAPRIEHQLELGSTKRTSHVGFAWSQTVTLATQEGEQMLPLTLANSLRFAWPGDEFLDEMACRFSG